MVQGLGFTALRALESRFLSSEQGQDEEGGGGERVSMLVCSRMSCNGWPIFQPKGAHQGLHLLDAQDIAGPTAT